MDIIEFAATKKTCDDMGFVDYSYKGYRGYLYLNCCCYILDLHSLTPSSKRRFQSNYGHIGDTVEEVEKKLVEVIPAGNKAKDYGEGNINPMFADLAFQKYIFEKGTRKQIAEWLDVRTGEYIYADEHRRPRGEPVLSYESLRNKMKDLMEECKTAYYDISSYRKADERIKKEKAAKDAATVTPTPDKKPRDKAQFVKWAESVAVVPEVV